MGTLFILVGVIYAAALLVQMLFYVQCAKETALVQAAERSESNQVVAAPVHC